MMRMEGWPYQQRQWEDNNNINGTLPPITGKFGHHIKISRRQRWGNDFNNDAKDGAFVEIKAIGRGRVNDHNIDDPRPPS